MNFVNLYPSDAIIFKYKKERNCHYEKMLMHIIHVYMHLPIVHVNFDARKTMFAKFPNWSVGSNFSDCIVRWYHKVDIDSVNTKTLLPSLLKLFK